MRRIRFNRHTLFSTVLNVAGLTLAFSIFMTVMVQVLYDLRYDRCYPEHEKVYRLESMLPTNPGMWYPTVSRPVIEYLKTSLPQAGAVSVYQYIKGESRLFNETGTDSPGVSLRVAYSEHDLLRVFPFEIISGDTAGYGMPRTALISARGSKKLFGDESPLGKEVCFTVGDDPRPFRIVAVYKDFPDNSSADNELILSSGLDGLENWGAWSWCCYVKLSTEEGAAAAVDSAASHIGRQVFQADVLKLRLTRLHDVYWSKDVMTDVAGKGNRSTTIVLLTVAIAVILIAGGCDEGRPDKVAAALHHRAGAAGICPQYRGDVARGYFFFGVIRHRFHPASGQSGASSPVPRGSGGNGPRRRHFPGSLQHLLQPRGPSHSPPKDAACGRC